MLNPDYLIVAADDVANIYSDLHMATLEDVARRIVKTLRQTGELQLTATAQYQIERLQKSGLSMYEIESRVIEIINNDPNYKFVVDRETAALNANLSEHIGKTRRKSVIEVRELFKDVSERNYHSEKRVYDRAGVEVPPINTYAPIISANISRLNTNFNNMTGTFAINTTYKFHDIINNAYSKVASGAFSYQTAVSQAVDTLAKEGVKIFTYESGRADTIEVAVLRAVRTSVAQTAGEMTKQMMIDTGTLLVQTSAHINARTHKDGGFKDHTTWHGKVFYWKEIASSRENSEKPLTDSDSSGIISVGGGKMNFTGASGAIPRNDTTRMDSHAERYYEEIRNRTTDVATIAANTGFSVEDIKTIKHHIFTDYHDLGEDSLERFDPDYDMAVSWQRLIDGKNIQEMDLVLLRHELHESKLMKQGTDYRTAHDTAELLHDYSKFIRELNLMEGVR
jgi:hypothetical protein